jgi:hypothetical protein
VTLDLWEEENTPRQADGGGGGGGSGDGDGGDGGGDEGGASQETSERGGGVPAAGFAVGMLASAVVCFALGAVVVEPLRRLLRRTGRTAVMDRPGGDGTYAQIQIS